MSACAPLGADEVALRRLTPRHLRAIAPARTVVILAFSEVISGAAPHSGPRAPPAATSGFRV